MRGKRSKQYRKLMQQYGLTFGFREPYQVLVDAGMLEAAVVQFKMDLVNGLTRTLHGEVKPMLTQCTIRHLYNLPTLDSRNASQPQPQPQAQSSQTQSSSKSPRKPNSQNPPPAPAPTLTNADKTAILTLARTFEKRRCDHAELDDPLSTHACLSSVIDPKSTQTNKHRYVLAVQDDQTRDWARSIRGVPSIYVRRSVMIMEPMAEVSVSVRVGAEREKLRAGIKRKRGEGRDEEGQGPGGAEGRGVAAGERKAKKAKGVKGVNPLSVRKPKKRVEIEAGQVDEGEGAAPKKRRRKHKGAGGEAVVTEVTTGDGDDGE